MQVLEILKGFFSLLKNYGLKLEETISFPDHHNYSKNEIKDLIVKAKKNSLKLLTTEKDFFRIKQLGLKKIDYVECAVSKKKIPLEKLNYWNVELQEAYFSPIEVKQRFEKLK